MRTAEEIRAWISEIVLREPGTWRPLQQVLEFIDSEPPCEHVTAIGQFLVGSSWMPFRVYVDHDYKDNEMEFHGFKFCPDCGEKLQ